MMVYQLLTSSQTQTAHSCFCYSPLLSRPSLLSATLTCFAAMADMDIDPPASAPVAKDNDKKRFEVKKVRSCLLSSVCNRAYKGAVERRGFVGMGYASNILLYFI